MATEGFYSVNVKSKYPALERQLEAIKRRLNVSSSPTPPTSELDVDVSIASMKASTAEATMVTSSSLVALNRNTSLSKNSIVRVSLSHSVEAEKSQVQLEASEGELLKRHRIWDDPSLDDSSRPLEREFIILLAKSKTEEQMSSLKYSVQKSGGRERALKISDIDIEIYLMKKKMMTLWIEYVSYIKSRRTNLSRRIREHNNSTSYRQRFSKKYLRSAFNRLGKWRPAVMYHVYSIQRRAFQGFLGNMLVGNQFKNLT